MTGGAASPVALVAPGDPGFERGQVIPGPPVEGEGDQTGTCGDVVVPGLGFEGIGPARPLDVAPIAAFTLAPPVEDLVLVPDHPGPAEPMPDVGVPGGVTEGAPFSATADEDGDVPGWGRVQLLPTVLDPG